MKKKKGAAGEKLSRFLDVPLDTILDVPRITLTDSRELSVENYKSLEGFGPDAILLRSKEYMIRVLGQNLEIVAITDDEILVRGSIHSVELGV